jgi:hypothetical protein
MPASSASCTHGCRVSASRPRQGHGSPTCRRPPSACRPSYPVTGPVSDIGWPTNSTRGRVGTVNVHPAVIVGLLRLDMGSRRHRLWRAQAARGLASLAAPGLRPARQRPLTIPPARLAQAGSRRLAVRTVVRSATRTPRAVPPKAVAQDHPDRTCRGPPKVGVGSRKAVLPPHSGR